MSVNSQFQEAYNALYAGQTIVLDFMYLELAKKYLSALRTFKARQDVTLKAMGFLDKAQMLKTDIQLNGEIFQITLSFTDRPPQPDFPKFRILENEAKDNG